MTIIILRFPVRIRMVGVKGLTPDDYVGIAVSKVASILPSTVSDVDCIRQTLTAWLSCMTLVEQVRKLASLSRVIC